MATIYSAPKEIKKPDYDFLNGSHSDWQAEEKRYSDELKAFCLARKKGKNVGEILNFPVADGYAQYMIASVKPVELIHMETMDCYEFDYVHLLTADEIQKKLDQQESLKKLFGKK